VERACRAAGFVLPPVALTLAALVYFRELLPLPQPTRYLAGDFASYFYPVFRYVAEEIQAGRMPHWTPYLGVGYPLLSDIEASVFYPPIRLLTWLVGPPTYLALEIYAIAHYVIAGLGMFVLLRQVGLPALAAGAGALPFMLSGFLWAHAAHLTILQAAAWLPWLVAAHARALATRTPTWTVVAAAAFAVLVLGGHPQIALYAAVAVGFYTFVHVVTAGRGTGWRTRLTPPAITATTVLLALGVAAPQLAPTLSLAPATSRWQSTPEFLAAHALTFDQLLSFLVPFAHFGTHRFHSMDELYAYVGIGTLVLASAGVVLRRDVWSGYFGGLALLGLALAVVPQVPGLGTLLPFVPIFGIFRAAARATLLTHFGVAGLAALGLEAFGRAVVARDRRLVALTWSWRAAVALALAGGAVVAIGRIPTWVGPLARQFPEFYAYFAGMLVANVVALELWRRLQPPGLVAPLVMLLLLAVNLNLPHRAAAWTLSAPEPAWQSRVLVRRLHEGANDPRVWNEGWLHRRGPSFEANAGLLHRLQTVSHYTSLPLARFDEFFQAIADPWRESTLVDLLSVRYLVLPEGDARPYRRSRYDAPRLEAGEELRYDLQGLLDRAIGEVSVVMEPEAHWRPTDPVSVTVDSARRLDVCIGCPPEESARGAAVSISGATVIASAPLRPRQDTSHLRLQNRLRFGVRIRAMRLDEVDLYALGGRYRQLGLNLWENDHALPRTFLTEEVLVLPDTGQILSTLLTVDPRRTAIVEAPAGCLGSLRPPERGTPPVGEATIVEYRPTLVRVRTRHPRPTFLVLTDANYKDWRARVDGQRAGIHFANLAFRGVCVPAGEHEVEFRYHAFALERGLVISLACGVGMLGAVLVDRRRRRLRSP
jgi:hypothetical protein